MDDAARTLGAGRARRFVTIDVPLMLPGLLAGAGLVLLSAMKELPATLLLRPTSFETLAVRIWDAQEGGFLGEVGLASTVLVLGSALLTWLLVVRRTAPPGLMAVSATLEAPPVGIRQPTPRKLLLVVGLVVAVWAMVALPARATYGARVTADEPQYLLSALSLGEDLDLDISDEIRERAYTPFHAATLDPQTEADEDGREFSPHDPLLPVVLAVPMALGGWVAAKATLAVLAGVLAALLVWTAVERFGVGRRPATVVVLAFALSAPLTSYGTQVYPELPAALAVTVAIAALTGLDGSRGVGGPCWPRWSPCPG